MVSIGTGHVYLALLGTHDDEKSYSLSTMDKKMVCV